MGRRLLLVALGLALVGGAVSADDSQVVELQTAGYYELVARARELGLDTTGTVSELRTRVARSLGVELPVEAVAAGKTLTIDSAREAGLVTVEAPGDGKLLRLSGGLQVTLVDLDKKVTHIIQAGELWYDQAHEEMTARGNVVYTMVRETSKEVFRGDSLTFRLSDSQGVFYEGASDRARTVGTQTLTFRYSGEAIRRSAADLVVLDAGTITSSLGTDPYYRIQAKKIWVLAPGEWGLQDAVLYLGRVPVLYFPFFFQPGDEFFFNPVLSFPSDSTDRRGTSLQTTTYFWGKKTRDQSRFSFLQMDDSTQDADRVRKGLFLVRGKSADKTDGKDAVIPSSWVLKYQADFYSNLGFLTGVEVSAPGAWQLKTLSAFLGMGVTRTVDTSGLTYSVNPFQAALDPWALSDWNSSYLGSWKLPFRWGGRFALDSGWGALSLEYYSDPLLYNDLTANRSENFSVFSLVGFSSSTTTTAATVKSSLQWSGSFTLAPAAVAASLLWDSKNVGSTSSSSSGNPGDTFYYPSQLTLPQVTLSFAGTLWPLTGTTATAATTTTAVKSGAPPTVDPSAQLVAPGDQVPGTDAGAPTASEPTTEGSFASPDRAESLTLASEPGWTSGVTWSFKPTAKTDTRFDSTAVTQPSDVGWDVLTSQWSASYDGKLNLSTGWSDGLWTATESISMHQQAQNTWYLGPGITSTPTYYSTLDRQQTSSLLTQSLGSSVKPFVAGGAWRDSSLQYTLSTKLWEETYAHTLWLDGTKDTVTAHSASSQAVVYLWEGTPVWKANAGLVTTLAPLDPVKTWSGGTDVTFPWAKLGSSVSAKQTETALTFDPWESTAEWTPTTGVSLKETYQYDLGYSYPLVSTTTFTGGGFTAQYRHQRTTPYSFNTATLSWDAGSSQAFIPQQMLFAYALNLPSVQWWYYRNTLTSTLNYNWTINLQKYSEMPMTLSYTLGYKLSKFLDLSVTGGMQNKTAYRYIPALAQTFGAGAVTVVNPLVDLWDSLCIWDQAALRRTGFKMTTLALGLTHYLDDWQIKLDYSGSPQLNSAGTQYQWTGTMTLLVSWIPIPELKTQANVDKNGILTIAKNSGS